MLIELAVFQCAHSGDMASYWKWTFWKLAFFYCFLKHESLLFCCCAKSAKSAINEWNKIEFIAKKAFRSSKSASFLSEKRDIHVDTASRSLSIFDGDTFDWRSLGEIAQNTNHVWINHGKLAWWRFTDCEQITAISFR